MPFKNPLHYTLGLKTDRQGGGIEKAERRSDLSPAFHTAHATPTNPGFASRTPSVLTVPTAVPILHLSSFPASLPLSTDLGD